jgi:hypothetical protein
MTMRALLPLFVACLALGGCPSPKSGDDTTASEGGSGGGGGGLFHEIQSEMLGSNKATRQGVAIDVYYDVSGSSANLKRPLGKILEKVVDIYPDAVPYSYSFFGKSCMVQGSGVANVQSLRRSNKEWVSSKMEDHTTNLSEVFKHIRSRAEDDPKTDFCAVVVSDGGYEDPEAARVEFKKLKSCENLRMITFVGVHTGDNSKLEKLQQLTKVEGGDTGVLTVYRVTDANNDSAIQDARGALREAVSSAKKAD